MTANASSSPLLVADNLRVSFANEDGAVHAVRGVSFELAKGETLGVVGESGSGKSVTQMALLDLLPPSADVAADRLLFAGRDLNAMPANERLGLRGKQLSMVFQDPMTSLNPFLTLGTQIAEMHRLHRGLRGASMHAATVESLAEVGIPKPELRVEQYPHEFSGGMRQRAMIAMMLAAEPELLIADEPTTALDVTVQAQILELLNGLQRDRGMSIILITHDLGVVAGFAHRIAVMYAGRIVEEATTDALFARPSHPYTRGLLGSIPRLDRDEGELTAIPGSPPDLANLAAGCPFRERCSFVVDRCSQEEPPLLDRSEGSEAGHRAACWREPTELATPGRAV